MTDQDITKQIDTAKMRTIDVFFDMYPELKKNKEEIMMNVFEKYGKPIKYIFTRHIFENNLLYVGPDGIMLDENLNFKGIFYENKYYLENDGYYLDDDKYKISNLSDLDKIMGYKN